MAPLTIELFGTIRVLLDGEPFPHLRSRKALWLLALLTLRNGRPASREWIATALWPDTNASTALGSLRTILSELRRALGAQANRVQAIGRTEIVLELSDAHVDCLDFDRAIQNNDLERAISLHQGVLLEGCSQEWATQERNVREQQCLSALLTLGDQANIAGKHEKAIRLFTQASHFDPWRDAPIRGRMTAMAALGDLNAAAQTYREFAQTLSREAALSPDPETTALHQFLRAATRQAQPEKKPTPNNLPGPTSDLIGREDERTECAARLRRHRIVTLTGIGGIGKTRLAITAARDLLTEFPDGVWFIPLDRITDPSALPRAIATELNLREETLKTIADHLQNKKTLLVVDNCEHLVDAAAESVAYLVDKCSTLRVLATSRESLRIPGEAIFQVPSLPFPNPQTLPGSQSTRLRVAQNYESVRLFSERAQSVQPNFTLTQENLDDVIRICAQLDGIPLAIELAAARVRSMPIAALAAQFDDSQMEILTSRGRGLPNRQATLKATMDWSHALLLPEEARTFRQVSVFLDGWTLEAADAVVGPNAITTLESLIDKSLVNFDPVTDRYRMLETVRQYAAEKLSESNESEAAKERHRDWYLSFAESASKNMGGKDQALWLQILSRDHANHLRAIASFANDPSGGPSGLKITSALWRYWNIRGPRSEGNQHLLQALGHVGAQSPTIERGNALNGAGALAFHAGDRGAAKPLFMAALDIRRAHGDIRGTASSLVNLANVLTSDGDHEAAQAAYEECLKITEGTDHQYVRAVALLNLGYLYFSHLGEHTLAHESYNNCLHIYRKLEDPSGVAFSLEGLGFVALARGQYDDARTAFEEAKVIRQGIQDQDIAWSLDYLGEVALSQGDLETAKEHFERSQALFQETGETEGLAATASGLACVAIAQNRLSQATPLLETALTLFRSVGERRSACRVRIYQAEIAVRQGNHQSAQTILRETLADLIEIKSTHNTIRCLEAVALLWASTGQLNLAVPIWSASERERVRLGEQRYRYEEAERSTRQAQARALLRDTDYETLWAQGQATPIQEVTAQAQAHLSAAA